MISTKFYNETFEFNLTLILYDSTNKKDCKEARKIMGGIGYDDSDISTWLSETRAFVCGMSSNGILFFDTKGFEDYKAKERNARMIKTLAHECNHVKENVLDLISEKDGKRETECSMRISDWCFSKCMNTKFFKSMLK